MAPPVDVLVVRHTHWDREWYHPAGRFRQRLVALVDELLDPPLAPAQDRGDAPARPAPAHGSGEPRGGGGDARFLLDGQAIVVEDYLAVRPDRRAALAARLADGSLEAGPWYVLADELIPSGEALVRNLLAGRHALAALGAAPPPVLYSPDAFGHPAALPSLAAGFGCRLVIAWRGYGGPRWPAGDAVWWRAPDGATALLHHLPPDGYEFGSDLPPDPDAAAARWERMRDVLLPRARLGAVLVLNGADHHAPQLRWREALAALAAAAAPNPVRQVALRDVAGALVARAERAGLPTVAGELRDSYGHAWTLQGTFAARAHQKRRNAAVERLLVRDAEPWLALLALRGAPGAGDAPRRAALLRSAWTTLLRCHPHDTLCGCSVDAVARAMDARLDDAAAQGAGLREDALHALVGHDPVAARVRRAAWSPTVLARNRAPRARGGVAEVELLTFVRDVGVGPGSAGRWRAVPPASAPPPPLGRPVQVLERALRHDRVESPRHYPDDDLVDAARALVWLEPVPGCSVALLPHGAAGAGEAPAHPVRAGENTLDNGLLRAALDPRGRLRVDVPGLGAAVDDVLGFEDVGDAGDLYTHSPLGRPLDGAWCTGVRTLHRGPLRGEVEARYRLRVPAAAEPAEDGLSRPPRRARRHAELPLAVRVSLDAAARFVRIRVEGENVARDHRLRIVLRTGVADGAVLADAAFGPIERRPVDAAPAERAVERPPETAPLHRWVALRGGAACAVVVSDGLAEYEAMPDGRVAITLVRAVGELSRPDLPERPGHAGWPAPTPEAQCPGPFAAELALAFLDPRDPDLAGAIERLADDVLLPLVGETLRAALPALAPSPALELEGAGLAFGAARPSDDGAWVVLRCVNAGDGPTAGRWRLGLPVREARLGRLDETPGEAIAVDADAAGAVVRFDAGARAIVTILVR